MPTGNSELVNFPKLEILVPNATELPNEEFALARRQGLGASDASVILGLQNKWKTEADIIEEKCRNYLTQEEKEIGNKVAVRKGRDLEPLILRKATAFFSTEILKPCPMYRLKESPWLLVDFDGVLRDPRGVITVAEAKFVTTFGEKYYNKNAAIKLGDLELTIHRVTSSAFLAQQLDVKARVCGIPDYYYAQVQQQLLAIDAPYGYLVALHEKDWELRVYVIPADPEVQAKILTKSLNTWTTIQQCKK